MINSKKNSLLTEGTEGVQKGTAVSLFKAVSLKVSRPKVCEEVCLNVCDVCFDV